MTFDPTKPVRTRDGRKARIICTDMNRKFRDCPTPIAALVPGVIGESAHAFTSDGRFIEGNGRKIDDPSPLDLVNIPEKIEGWVNVYRTPGGDTMNGQVVHPTKDIARACLRPGCPSGMTPIACIHVSFEEGEGLS